MKVLNTLLGFVIFISALSGCTARSINTPNENVKEAESVKEPFVIVNPFRDDPDNPSPHNPLIKRFGDIPEVRTYMRLKQKLLNTPGLTSDEAIAYYTAELHLYQYDSSRNILNGLKESKKINKASGLPDDAIVFRYTGITQHNLVRGDNVTRILPDGTKIISDPRLTNDPTIIPPGKRRELNLDKDKD
ncbi:MAG: hypothetical protein OXL96_26380 [Candidatus Poribacteria bacterium]|nr:hypothetical protein [Candidatus Poribacteria bacterium]